VTVSLPARAVVAHSSASIETTTVNRSGAPMARAAYHFVVGDTPRR
jgi:hypothetical protein